MGIQQMNDIQQSIEKFEAISLKDMDAVKLMNRIDTKYIVASGKLPAILGDLSADYRILEIEGTRKMQYRTTYYDTPDFAMYTDHQNGKMNRFKIRNREYVVSGIHFLEVKFKNNKGRTLKERVKRNDGALIFHDNEEEFLQESAPYSVDDLSPRLWNRFIRLTLVHKYEKERITVDYDLVFMNENKEEAEVPQLSVIEVKQEHYHADSAIVRVLRRHRVQEMRVSKYCIGTAMLNPSVKRNRFKAKLLAINKLN